MAGKVRTREKCPACGGAFSIIEERGISCPKCSTHPKTFFLVLYWDGKKQRIARDRDGNMLDSYRRAHRLLESIRLEIEMHTFRLDNYISTEVEQFRVRTLMPKWLTHVKGRGRAKSYTEKLDYYARDIYLPRLADLDIRQLTTGHVQDLEFHLRNERVNRRTGGRLTPKTVKNIMEG